MWFYLGAILLIFFPWLLMKKDEVQIRNWLIYSWVILSLIEGLRAFHVGTDTSAYVRMFESQAFANYEIGYKWISIVIHSISTNASVYLLILAALTNGLIIWSIWKMSNNPNVSLFAYISLYYYFNSFNAVRQYIAVGFVLVAFVTLREKKYIKSGIAYLLAVSFHNTAVVGLLLIPIFILNNWKEDTVSQKNGILRKLKNLVIPILIFIAFQFVFGYLYDLFLRLFPQYAYYERTSSYLLQGTDAIQQKVLYSALLLLYVVLCDGEEWHLILSFAVTLSFMLSYFRAMSRFLWYFDVFTIFAIADMWDTHVFTRQSLRIFRCVIILLLFAFLLYYLSAGVMRVTPYSFSF